MLLYTPLSGFWLNMAESIQRILKRRALDGSHPQSPEEIIAWVEAVVAAWNRAPGTQSSATSCTRWLRSMYAAPSSPRPPKVEKWRQTSQVTH